MGQKSRKLSGEGPQLSPEDEGREAWARLCPRMGSVHCRRLKKSVAWGEADEAGRGLHATVGILDITEVSS